MKSHNQYDITLLDGDLLILAHPIYDSYDNNVTATKKATASAASSIHSQSLIERMYRRENELPYPFLQWMD